MNAWLSSRVPALGCRPIELLGSKDGRELVDATQSLHAGIERVVARNLGRFLYDDRLRTRSGMRGK